MTRDDAKRMADSVAGLRRAGDKLLAHPRPNALRAYLYAIKEHDRLIAEFKQKIADAARDAG